MHQPGQKIQTILGTDLTHGSLLRTLIHITNCTAAHVPIQTDPRYRTPVYIEAKPLPFKRKEIQSLYNYRTGIQLVS